MITRKYLNANISRSTVIKAINIVLVHNRRLLHYSNPQREPIVSMVLNRTRPSALPVLLPAIWPVFASWVFTKTLKPALILHRELGVRLLVYIDDILVLMETEEIAKNHTSGLIYLLIKLGYIVHPEETAEILSRDIEFLGMTMELGLSGRKFKKAPIRGCKDQAAHTLSLCGVMPNRQIQLGDESCSNKSPVLQSIAKGSGQGFGEEQPELQYFLSTIPASKVESVWWTYWLVCWNEKSLVMTQPDLQI